MTLEDLRRYAVGRTFFRPTTLSRAMAHLGFLQADPIRAPARAQDLILRHRVRAYRAGDLERRYPTLSVEEDFLINYGFVSRPVRALMHPRHRGVARSATVRKRTALLLDFMKSRGPVHPREVEAHFDHGTVTNYWGGSSSATTHLLEDMHYRGLIRVARREAGVKIYEVRSDADSAPDRRSREARLDALVDAVVAVYTPVPRATLAWLVNRLQYATPQWQTQLKPAFRRALERFDHARIGHVDWFWPTDEHRRRHDVTDTVRFLAPFDPLVWDRRRFELFWGWSYRLEAYVPAAKRQFGYYALPVLWRDTVVGWANVRVEDRTLRHDVQYVGRRPCDAGYREALEDEIARLTSFLAL